MIELNESFNLIEVTAPDPQQIGDIIPAASALAQALENLDYTVQQGDICLSNAIDVCFAGYSPNANGNNASFPYLCILAPQPPDAEHAISGHRVRRESRPDPQIGLQQRQLLWRPIRQWFRRHHQRHVHPPPATSDRTSRPSAAWPIWTSCTSGNSPEPSWTPTLSPFPRTSTAT